MLRLALKNQLKHPLRSLFTLASVTSAIFLLCILRSLVTTLESAVNESATDRIIVQSAVSLFVSLPESYMSKIEGVEGVDKVCSWNWFGGKYPGEEAPLNQFGVRMSTFMDMYGEVEIIEGSREEFETKRTACIIGKDLAARGREGVPYKVGDTIPIVSELFVRTDGTAWDFEVVGIYESDSSNVDNMTMFFNYDYLEENREAGDVVGPQGVSLFVVSVDDGEDPTNVMGRIDELYENGPQRVQSTSEAAFQAQFASMVGNIPFLVNSIGFGVLAAVILATLNTMLMVAREQLRDMGVLRALGFGDGALTRLMMFQSMLLTFAGGMAGIGLALVASPAIASVLGTSFPGYEVGPGTLRIAFGLTVALGLVAGAIPAFTTRRFSVVEALSSKA